MKKEATIIVVLALVLVILFGTYIIRGGYYPIALVHGEWISTRQFNREHAVYAHFYREFGTVNQITISDEELFQREVGRDGLDRLIDDVLVGRAVNDFAKREAKSIVEEYTLAIQNSPDIGQLREVFGGINESEFNQIVIEPQAKRVALGDYLVSQGETFDNWLRDARSSARVVIFASDYEWDGEQVIVDD